MCVAEIMLNWNNKEDIMRISECMTKDVRIASPEQPIRAAAHMMKEIETGFVPVGENDRLVGMITDRDIAVRAIAAGKGPETPIRDIMTEEVIYCFDDEEIDEVASQMAGYQVRRLPVLTRQKRLIGIVSLGDIAKNADATGETAGAVLSLIVTPGGDHRQ